MGVRGLETFMHRYCKDAFEVVNLKEIAEKYKEETGLDPIIAWDIESCYSSFYGFMKLEWTSGGEYKTLQEGTKSFLKKFKNINIKFYIVFEGMTVSTRNLVRHDRQIGKLKERKRIFELYDSKMDVKSFLVLPPLARKVIKTTILSDENCICKCAINEADDELAAFAATNGCFAFLTRDTDFIIYEGAQYCLSFSDLDLENMRMRNYNRRVLAKNLNIDESQLPFFATLCGTDLIRFEELIPFHKKLTNGETTIESRISAVARYMEDNKILLQDLKKISLDVFHTEEFENRLKESVESYSVGEVTYFLPRTGDDHWDKILLKGKVNSFFECIIFEILTNENIEVQIHFLEEEKDKNLLTSPLALLSLRKKLYGMILSEKPGSKNHFVVETLIMGELGLHTTELIRPWFFDHPGLLTLWDVDDQSEKTVNLRWKSFCKGVSDKLNPKKIMKLPKTLTIPFLALFYLQHEVNYKIPGEDKCTEMLEKFEIEVILLQAVIVNKSTVGEVEKKGEDFGELPQISRRAMHISALFQETCEMITILSAASGRILTLEETSAANFFQGKIYRILYAMFSSPEKNFRHEFFSDLEKKDIKCYNRLLKMIGMDLELKGA